MADIVATATLDATSFSAGLNDALKAAREWRRDVTSVLDFDPFQTAGEGIERFKRAAAEAASGLQATTAAVQRAREDARAASEATSDAAKTVATDLDATGEAVKRVITSLTKWQEAGARTREGFEDLKRETLDMLDAALKTVDANDASSISLQRLRDDIEATTFAQVEQANAVTSIGDAVIEYRNKTLGLRNAVESSLISTQEAIQLAKRFRDEALAAASGVEMWSTEWRNLLVAAGRADRTLATLEGRLTKLGLSQNVNIALGGRLTSEQLKLMSASERLGAVTQELTGSYQQLAGAVMGALAAAGVGRLLKTLKATADEAAAARAKVAAFYAEAANVNQLTLAEQTLKRLQATLRLTEGQLADAASALMNAGLNVKQAGELIMAGAALAERNSLPLTTGIEAVTQAIMTGRRETLRSLGVYVDFGAALKQAGMNADGTTRALSTHEQLLARYGAIVNAAAGDVQRLASGQTGFAAATTRVTTAITTFRENLGQTMMVALTPFLNLVARIIELFNSLPGIIRGPIIALTTFAALLAGVGVAYGTLRAALVKTQAVQVIMNGLLVNESILRSRIGGQLLTLAARYKLLTAAQLENAAAQRAALGPASLLNTSLKGIGTLLRGLVSGLRGAIAAAAGFVATPLGATLVAIAAAAALVVVAVRKFPEVLKPAMDAFAGSIRAVKEAFASAFAEGTRLGEATRRIGDAFNNVLISIAAHAAKVVAKLSSVIEYAAIVMQFWTDVINEGWGVATTNFSRATAELEERERALFAAIDDATRAAREGRQALEDVADTTELTAEQLEELARKVAAAEASFTTFQNRLRGMRLDLLPEGLEKDIAKVRESYRLLRNEIRQAAEENAEFKPFEKQLLAEAFELEAQEVLRLQREYAERRRQEAEQQARELATAITERERAIVDAQTRGQLNTVQALTLERRRRLEDTEVLYATLIAKAREYGRDATRLEELRTRELAAINNAYARDITKVYDDLHATLTEKQQELLRVATEARGDKRGLLALDYDRELRELTRFYADARREAAGNAALLAEIDATERADRLNAARNYWAAYDKLIDDAENAILDREEAIARARADLMQDDAATLRLNSAATIREINRIYDDLEAAAAGNATELARIAQLRNEELALADAALAKSLEDLADKATLETQRPLIEALTRDLDEASEATLAGVEAQLRSWRVAYGSNGEVVKLIDAALAQVAREHDRLAKEAADRIDKLVTSTKSLTDTIFQEDARRDLSQLDLALLDATNRANDLRRQQAAISNELLRTTGAAREELLRQAQIVDDALEVVQRNILRDAKRIVEDAIDEYQRGLTAARATATTAAVDLLQRDVQATIAGLTSLQVGALAEARTSLLRGIATLTAYGVDTSLLTPLEQQVQQVDALMSRHARATADYAAEQYSALRDVARATLDEASAQRVTQATHEATIRLRKAALEEAQREGTTLEEITRLTRDLTTAQLDYAQTLDAQVAALQATQGRYRGVYAAASDLATLLNRPVPPGVIQAQRQLALADLESVRAAQQAGQSYAEYNQQLAQAVGAWREFQTASTQAITTTATAFRREFEEKLATTDPFTVLIPNRTRVHELAMSISEAYSIGVGDAERRVREFITGARNDLLEGLELHDPTVLLRIFDDLNTEARDTPGVIASIDDEIQALKDQVEALKATVAAGLDFDAAGRELVSAYQAVLVEVNRVTGDAFAGSASDAVTAFLTRFEAERDKLTEELTSKIGDAATTAGAAAGEGLMTAFARGVTANRAVLLDAVEAVLREVRARLPSSDAKKGPLSDLTHSGRMLIRTFALGAASESDRLAGSMNSMLRGIVPNASFTAATAAGGGGRSAALVRGPVTVQVDARNSAAPGPMSVNARRLVADVQRELHAHGLTRKRRP